MSSKIFSPSSEKSRILSEKISAWSKSSFLYSSSSLEHLYVEDKDLYIEYNGTWTHGNHMFDINNENDLKLLNIWKEKSINHKYYNTAIYVWTILDLEKY